MSLTPTPPLSLSVEALDALGRRAERAGLNAAAAPHEARVEGWLLRLSPGKAKRSRCVNALAAGTLPLEEILARCRMPFDHAGLPLILRLTPFSQPGDLDDRLAAMGWTAFDPADVMVLPTLEGFGDTGRLQALTPVDYAALIGRLRGSSAEDIHGHAQRLAHAPVPHQAFKLEDRGELLACGQIAIDPAITPATEPANDSGATPPGSGAMAGLFDIFTPEAQRGRGHGQRLCAALLAESRRQGAQSAYLQVGADNHTARRLYARLGFLTAYRYHYRSSDPRAWA
ncbi:GNAT family N-acetyltransferase [Roseateles amylovorans]|uniref:GNAT family N-acetyltransferase n=1 Tax=Roseateles amylovorans TaxID=2978473 RepID=A0ABY6B0U6_9BURK|nr:GNAT family N-acetyltransferase [Roseateles amylovorans]UXH78465.1 GNAT family N-acetyltransferase [Roseateles amylovorans]